MKTPLLDTDTISFFLKGNAAVIRQMNDTYQRDAVLNISVISLTLQRKFMPNYGAITK